MRRGVAVILVGMSLGPCLTSAGGAWAADRSAAEILKELDAFQWPRSDGTRVKDRAYSQAFVSRLNEASEKWAALVDELYRAAPDHERFPQLMLDRWDRLIASGKGSGLQQEIDGFLPGIASPKIRLDALYLRGRVEVSAAERTGALDPRILDDFIKLEQKLKPEKRRGDRLLGEASRVVRDERAKLALESRLLKEYPDSPVSAYVRGQRRLATAAGTPFTLEFKDAITGSSVSTRRLRGKVVVVDFWASWCVPCVKELPSMKELHEKYRGYGVEFIGVSLDHPPDQGGLEALKKCVAEQGVSWPQYYQGQSHLAFSTSWGVHVIPTVFVIDPAGNVYSTEARGKLDTIIPELIEARERGQFDTQPVYRPRRRTRLKKPNEP